MYAYLGVQVCMLTLVVNVYAYLGGQVCMFTLVVRLCGLPWRLPWWSVCMWFTVVVTLVVSDKGYAGDQCVCLPWWSGVYAYLGCQVCMFTLVVRCVYFGRQVCMLTLVVRCVYFGRQVCMFTLVVRYVCLL